MLPRAHRQGVLTHHTQGPGGYLWITEEDRPTRIEPITVPVPARGALLMTNLTPHMSTQHSVDIVRWAIDVRYQSATVPNNVGELPADFDQARCDLGCDLFNARAQVLLFTHGWAAVLDK